ncbi:hypothetical protein MMC07_005561 [Pseudocyphellaria aurata]|nr:hypothetical protein [Pseudocyphellaria aurata]
MPVSKERRENNYTFCKLPQLLHYRALTIRVLEREDPKLRDLPLAVQQKQIIVTCNYEARRRGLHKLQLLKEARKICPDVIVVLGEDLGRFRNASKELFSFLKAYAWSGKVERLGFDEVFIDVTDMVDYNVELLNRYDLTSSFYHLDRNDPTTGFGFDGSRIVGHVFPATAGFPVVPQTFPSASPKIDESVRLCLRLVLGSHLAQHLRHQLEERKGYTSTAGISTNKLLSKLVGNLNKPKGQTTLMPPYGSAGAEVESSVTKLIDGHEIGKLPGIGFKLAGKIRSHVLGRPATFDASLIYGGTKEMISVKEVRMQANMGPEMLETLLGSSGAPKGIGAKIWGWMNGIDDSEVSKARGVPQQISIEDSYLRLDFMEDVKRELLLLGGSLIRRMRLDLMSNLDKADNAGSNSEEISAQNRRDVVSKNWIAHPRTLRLTTRPRLPLNPDGTRVRTFARVSKSCNMPSIMFSKSHSIEYIAEKVVLETLLPLFRKLHPEHSGWNLSLVNVCATNMSLVTTDDKDGAGRDIGRMFKRQAKVLEGWKIKDVDVSPDTNMDIQQTDRVAHAVEVSKASTSKSQDDHSDGSEDKSVAIQQSFFEDERDDDKWATETDSPDQGQACKTCGAIIPDFAMTAHDRFHALPD